MSEGYSLTELLDYDNGMPFEELVLFKDYAQKAAIERGSAQVDGMVVALASLFDKKILKGYKAAVDALLKKLGPVHVETKQEKVDRTMKALRGFQQQMAARGWMSMSGPGVDDVPPWERK